MKLSEQITNDEIEALSLFVNLINDDRHRNKQIEKIYSLWVEGEKKAPNFQKELKKLLKLDKKLNYFYWSENDK